MDTGTSMSAAIAHELLPLLFVWMTTRGGLHMGRSTELGAERMHMLKCSSGRIFRPQLDSAWLILTYVVCSRQYDAALESLCRLGIGYSGLCFGIIVCERIPRSCRQL